MIKVDLAQNEKDLQEILALQKQNIPSSITSEELASQGFVTVVHDIDVLTRMHQDEPSIVVKDEEKVVGYCLAMTKNFRNDIPVLTPMFDMIDSLSYRERPLTDYNYIVCGQVCVAKAFRGMGLMDKMYQRYCEVYSKNYEVILTEIATRNSRSIRAHEKVGFQILHHYTAANGEAWDIVLWDWRKR